METINIHKFTPELHIKYLSFILNGKLPSSQSSMDTNRTILLYFAVSGLDVLGEIENIPEARKKSIINWIYSLQIVNNEELASGFQGSPTLNTLKNKDQVSHYKWFHIANTYTCLSTLLILGDDLGRVNRQSILDSLKTLQLPNGSFKGAKEGVEDDMRFVYCAACICHILDDWSVVNIEAMVEFILNSISYDGGIGQGPELESHSGSTFCALATLALSDNLNRLTKAQFTALRRWLLYRFDGGFTGRPNKPVDTCYTFWTGASLNILDAYEFIYNKNNSQFVLMTQGRHGGFSKWGDVVPDPMHTYLGLAGLSLMEFGWLNKMNCALNITKRASDHLKHIQEEQRNNQILAW